MLYDHFTLLLHISSNLAARSILMVFFFNQSHIRPFLLIWFDAVKVDINDFVEPAFAIPLVVMNNLSVISGTMKNTTMVQPPLHILLQHLAQDLKDLQMMIFWPMKQLLKD